MKDNSAFKWIVEAVSQNGDAYYNLHTARDAGEAWMRFDSLHRGMKWIEITVKRSDAE